MKILIDFVKSVIFLTNEKIHRALSGIWSRRSWHLLQILSMH